MAQTLQPADAVCQCPGMMIRIVTCVDNAVLYGIDPSTVFSLATTYVMTTEFNDVRLALLSCMAQWNGPVDPVDLNRLASFVPQIEIADVYQTHLAALLRAHPIPV